MNISMNMGADMLCTLPLPIFTLIEIWAFLLIVLGSANTVYAWFLRKRSTTISSAVSFVLAYFVWQVAFEFHHVLIGKTETISAISEKLVQLSWLAWVCTLTVLTLAEAGMLLLNSQYRRQRINPMTVKICADRMPCGICYWQENGRVVLSNFCMDRLCIMITGQPLLNGNSFRDALSRDVLIVQDKAWRFACRKIQIDGEPLYEMIASDITEEHSKIEALEKDTAVLSRIKHELQAYQTQIEESVRRKEILQAKISIHDEMNRLMLSTVAAGSGKKSNLDSALSLWERNALLLCMEAEDGSREMKEIEQLAELLNIRLVRTGALPAILTKKQRELFYSAAQEAIVNAVKHAEPTMLSISFVETETEICCIFENDGRLPCGKIRFRGGLANLSFLAQKQQAEVFVEAEDKFRLSLVFYQKK